MTAPSRAGWTTATTPATSHRTVDSSCPTGPIPRRARCRPFSTAAARRREPGSWSASGDAGPAWREHRHEWDDSAFDPSLLADETTRVGALEEHPARGAAALGIRRLGPRATEAHARSPRLHDRTSVGQVDSGTRSLKSRHAPPARNPMAHPSPTSRRSPETGPASTGATGSPRSARRPFATARPVFLRPSPGARGHRTPRHRRPTDGR